MEDSEWFPLAELSQRLGALVWVEDQVASVLDDWSRVDAHPQAAVAFATASGHHRWHSEIIGGCLPTSPQLRTTELIVAPTSGWDRSISVLRQITEPDRTAVRLRALARVIDPWIEREQSALLELARPVSDAPLMRWLNFVAQDHRADTGAIEQILSDLSSETVRFDDHVVVNALSLTD